MRRSGSRIFRGLLRSVVGLRLRKRTLQISSAVILYKISFLLCIPCACCSVFGRVTAVTHVRLKKMRNVTVGL